MGNSEVGHTNIGAGFVVYQWLTRIDLAVASGEFAANPALNRAIERAVDNGGTLHLLGLVSDGGALPHRASDRAPAAGEITRITAGSRRRARLHRWP